MLYIKKYKRGKSVIPDFDSMRSIYDDNGNLRTDINLGEKSWDLIINNATSRGYGSVNINGKNFTLYKKDKSGKIIKPWESKDWSEKNYDLSDASLVAAYNWIYRNDPSHTQLVYGSPVSPPTLDDPEKLVVKGEKIPDVPITNPSNNKYNVSNNLLVNILSMPDSGRKSNFRQTLGLYEDLNKYFENPKVARSMDYYYGRGNWEGDYYPTANGNISPKEAVKNILGFVYNNADLTNDRMGKTQDYLIKESKRIGRTIGGYDKLSYYDLLNMFSPENSSKYAHLFDDGRYKGNYKDFYERLYNLSASRNGMQGGELLDLFGDNWRNVLGQIINTLGIPSNLNGGILRMLFI